MAKTAKADTSAEEKKTAKKPAAKKAAAPKAEKAPKAAKAKPAKVKKASTTGGVQEWRGKDAAQLLEEVKALKKETFNLRFQKATGELRNTARIRAVRREIARLKTVLRENALQAAE